jgi:hypothetical protein
VTDDLATLRADVERLAAQLGNAVIATDAATSKVARLRADLDRLDAGLQALAEQQAAPTAPAEGMDATAWMVVVDGEAAAATLEALARWVAGVWSRWGPIPACWPWHPPVVSELLACQKAWAASFAQDASPIAPADWHARWRPAAHGQVTRALKGCSDSAGHRHNEQHWSVDHGHLAALALWWAACNSETPPPPDGPIPGLTRKDHR